MQWVEAGCFIIFTYPGQNGGKQPVSTAFYNNQGQCQNQWVLWAARLGPCSVVLKAQWTKGEPLTCWDPLLESQNSHGSQSPQDIHKSKPAPARTQRSPTTPKHARAVAHTSQEYHGARSSPLPCRIRPCFCLKLPMFLYGPVLHQCADTNLCMNYSKVSVKLVLKTLKCWSDDRLVISPMVSLPSNEPEESGNVLL